MDQDREMLGLVLIVVALINLVVLLGSRWFA